MLCITLLLKRDEKEIVNKKNENIENDYINFNDFITPNDFIGRKNNNEELSYVEKFRIFDKSFQ